MDNSKSHTLSWVFLLICGLFEVVWAYTMKLSQGFTVPLYTIITIAILAINLFLLEKPVSVLGIGVSYGVFTGLGIVGTTLVDIVSLGESISLFKLASIALLMIGVIGLKYCDSQEAKQTVARMANEYKAQSRKAACSEVNQQTQLSNYSHDKNESSNAR